MRARKSVGLASRAPIASTRRLAAANRGATRRPTRHRRRPTTAPTRLRCYTREATMATIEEALLAAPIPLDPNDPEFAGVRGELTRLFLAHKADLGMADHPD